jgi:hypothetical protein
MSVSERELRKFLYDILKKEHFTVKNGLALLKSLKGHPHVGAGMTYP